MNQKQCSFLAAKQPIRVGVWGRGTGKTSMLSVLNAQRIKALPRAKGFLSSKTYNILETKTLPAIEKFWNELNYHEYDTLTGFGHYVIGTKPPAWFLKPYSPTRSYEHMVSFWNGFSIELLSMDRPNLARGGSYDFGDIDEAALISREALNQVLIPSVRGNIHKFKDHSLHHNINMLTSMPWLTEGYHILEYADKALAEPDEIYYSEATIQDNVHVLGQKGIDRMRRAMTYVEWLVECENQRIVKLPDAFYHNWEDSRHVFSPKFHYEQGATGRLETKGFEQYKETELLAVSFDFGGWFNCATIWQERNNIEYCISSHHVKDDEGKISELVDTICTKYHGHRHKYVKVYGEPRGHDRNPTGDTVYEHVRRSFELKGWKCDIMATPKQTEGHEQRHYFMGIVLSEQNALLPKIRVNELCKDFILSIKSARTTKDDKKDKKKEKDRLYPQQHATHYTDTFDYYITLKHFNKIAAGTFGRGHVHIILD